MITILTRAVYINPSSSTKRYYESKGYLVESLGVRGKYKHIMVNVSDLLPHCNMVISYHCSNCDIVTKSRFDRIVNNKSASCESCNRTISNIGNNHGRANKGKTVSKMQGEFHPRWNPNKTEQKTYYSKVMSITRKHKHIYKTWNNYDKIGLCGVQGAYQLDHIVPIKYGFDNKIDPMVIGDISNLRLLTWQENNQKRNTI